MNLTEFNALDLEGQTATLQKLCDEANQKCTAWEAGTFDLGTPFSHCQQLESYADPLLLEIAKVGLVTISMPSEYHAPRFILQRKLSGAQR